MMVTWLLYTLLTSLLLVTAGCAMEWVARAFRAPVRAVWFGVVTSATVLSGASLLHEARPQPLLRPLAAPRAVSPGDMHPDVSAAGSAGSTMTLPRTRDAGRKTPIALARRLREIAALRVVPSRWRRYDVLLATVCLSLGVAGLLVVIASLIRLHRTCRSLVATDVDGIRVLVSRDLGPAVFGAMAPRVIVPRWIMELPVVERRTILLHEQQHAAARDPMLMLLGAVVLALQPWNALLWIAFARLRFAVEADCDARVLRMSRRGARWYGALLLHVCEHELMRQPARRLTVTAFVDSTSHLERRVRRMTDRQPRVRSLSTMSAVAGAVLCAAVAFSVRISNAHELAARAQVASPATERVVSVSSVAPIPSVPDGARPELAPSWRTALPSLVNSQREEPRAAVTVIAPAHDMVGPLAAPAAEKGRDTSITTDTLFVRASNPSFPMKVRILATSSDDAERVLVTDSLGRSLPWADTLLVNGPVRVILPAGGFQLRIESLSGDMVITTSPVTAPAGRGRWVNTLFGRSVRVSRSSGGGDSGLRVEGVGRAISQRIP